MADQYTHRISIKAADGGQWIVADLFIEKLAGGGVDTKVRIVRASEPLDLVLVDKLKAIVELVEGIYILTGGVKSISVREKGYPEPDEDVDIVKDKKKKK